MQDNRNNQVLIDEDEIDLYELWQTIWKRRRFIAIFCTAVVTISIVASLLMTKIYRSEATLIPISSSSSGLSAYAGLAAMAGMSLPSSGDDSTKIQAVLKSRTLKEAVISELDLINILNEGKEIPEDRDPLQYTLGIFDKGIYNVGEDKKTSLITITIDYKDPKLAQKIGYSVISNLQEILNSKALTVAKFNRIFLEEQVADQQKKLDTLQQKLAKYQKSTKIISPDVQLKGLMDLYSSLVSKKIETQVKLKSMEANFDSSNPQVKFLRDQLDAVKAQIKELEEKTNVLALPSIDELPESMVEYGQILQQLTIVKAVYENIVKAYEQAKIEEAKGNLYVQVIDEPNLPDIKFKPKRKLIVVVAAVTSLILAVFIVFFLEFIQNVKSRRVEIENQ
jgi:uncharacterized protein involved in exopolysaccharide biosynthesis